MNKYVEEGIKNGRSFNNTAHLQERLHEFHRERFGGPVCIVCKTEEFAVSLGEGAASTEIPSPERGPLDVPLYLRDPGKDSYEIACMHCGYRMRFWYLPFTWWEASTRG